MNHITTALAAKLAATPQPSPSAPSGGGGVPTSYGSGEPVWNVEWVLANLAPAILVVLVWGSLMLLSKVRKIGAAEVMVTAVLTVVILMIPGLYYAITPGAAQGFWAQILPF